MKSVRVAVRYTAETLHPMHALVCESPFVEREVILGETTRGGVTTFLFYVEGDRHAYESALASVTHVEEYHVTPEGDDAFFVYARESLREREARLSASFERDTVVVVPPVELLSDRTVRLTLVGHADELQAVLDDLPDSVDVDVLAVGRFARALDGRLTDRQRAACEAAWAVGYYELPRTGGIEAVASELDCAVSTASDLLRRAEARLVADALGQRRDA